MKTSLKRAAVLLAISLLVALLVPAVALAEPTYFGTLGSSGTGNYGLDTPAGLATDGLGNLYVPDDAHHRVIKYTTGGVYVREWGKTDLSWGTGNGEFTYPIAVALDRFGNMYVAEFGGERVQKFDASGAYVTQWSSAAPGGIAVSYDGRWVYVSSQAAGEVRKYSSTGVYQTSWSGFNNPRGVTTDRFGYVYVVDASNKRVQKLAPETGAVVRSFTDASRQFLQFVDLNCWDAPYSTDRSANDGARWLPDGSWYGSWGASGPHALGAPFGIAIDGAGIYVSEYNNDRIQMFRDDLNKTIERFAGANRYEVAANAAKDRWGATLAGIDDVVIVSGEDRAMCDALSAGGLAGVMDAPLLLTNSGSLSSATKKALGTMRATNGPLRIHVLGGTGSVSRSAYTQIAGTNPGGSIERISGSDRYVLSANIAKRVATDAASRGKGLPGVIVFNAESQSAFYDALAAGAISARQTMPMIAVRKASVPTSPKNCLNGTFAGKPRYVASGTAYISSGVYSAVQGTARMASSSDRRTAATQIAQYARGKGWLLYEYSGLANKLPDSLCGGVFMGMNDGVLLYTDSTTFPSATNTWVRAKKNGTMHGFIFGGTASISSGVQSGYGSALNAP